MNSRYVMPDYSIRVVNRIPEYYKRRAEHEAKTDAEALKTMSECTETGCPNCPSDCFGRMFRNQAY